MLAQLVLAVEVEGAVLYAAIALVILVYLMACWRIAQYAEQKGQNPVVFLSIGLVMSPMVSGLAVLLVNDPRGRE